MAMSSTYLLKGKILHVWWDQNLVYDMDHTICTNSISEYNFSIVVQNQGVLERQQKHVFCGTLCVGETDDKYLWYGEPRSSFLCSKLSSILISCPLLFQNLIRLIKPESEDKITCVKARVVQRHSLCSRQVLNASADGKTSFNGIYLFLCFGEGKGTIQFFFKKREQTFIILSPASSCSITWE